MSCRPQAESGGAPSRATRPLIEHRRAMTVGESHQAAAISRVAGHSDRRAYWVPIAQSFVLGVVFIWVLMSSTAAPAPRAAPLDITGDAASISSVLRALEQIAPGAYDVRVTMSSAGEERLLAGTTLGLLSVTETIGLEYAGANGPAVSTALLRTMPQVAQALDLPFTARDVRPLSPNDSGGLPLFYLVFGIVLASFLFSVASFTIASSLPRRGHWTGAILLAIGLGVTATLIARFVTHTIEGGAGIVALLATLASLAVSSATYLCLAASRVAGSTLAAIAFVVLGSASGGLLPGPFLPDWLALLRPVLPMGAAFTRIRDHVYFGGSHTLAAAVALITWAIVPICLAEIVTRLRHTSR
jgi:hypothetical protein